MHPKKFKVLRMEILKHVCLCAHEVLTAGSTHCPKVEVLFYSILSPFKEQDAGTPLPIPWLKKRYTAAPFTPGSTGPGDTDCGYVMMTAPLCGY